MEMQLEHFLETPGGTVALVAIIIWVLFWKGTALWKSAQRKELYWFVALLIFNTVGILPIIYIYFFSNREKKNDSDDSALSLMGDSENDDVSETSAN